MFRVLYIIVRILYYVRMYVYNYSYICMANWPLHEILRLPAYFDDRLQDTICDRILENGSKSHIFI